VPCSAEELVQGRGAMISPECRDHLSVSCDASERPVHHAFAPQVGNRLRHYADPEAGRQFYETPRSIVPRRRIGRLTDGYEASFLVLDRNPFEKLDAIDDIRLRVKQGCLLK
jgi:hypothetical protein